MNDQSEASRRPSSAGVYAYVTSGTEEWSTPEERRIGDQIVERAPASAQGMRLTFALHKHVVDKFAALDLGQFIDIGTGLPTHDYPHERLPQGSRVVYNDYNAEVIRRVQELLGDRDDMRYVEADVRNNLDAVLDAAADLFGGNNCTGVSIIGVIYFLVDEEVRELAQRLYDWCGPGSRLALTTFRVDPNDPNFQSIVDEYARQGMPFYPRSPEQLEPLLGSWQPDPGFERMEAYMQREMGRTIPWASEDQVGYIGLFIRP